MGHKISATWDAESLTDTMDFNQEGPSIGQFLISCEDDALVLHLTTTTNFVDKLEYVAGIHIARFGAKYSLKIARVRSDGTSGTTQGTLSCDEVEAHSHQKRSAREAEQSTSQ